MSRNDITGKICYNRTQDYFVTQFDRNIIRKKAEAKHD